MIVRAALAAAALAAIAPRAHADPWQGEAETGAEYDTNVHRVEQGKGVEAVPLLRAAAKIAARGGDPERLRWGLRLGGGSRTVLVPLVASEDVVLGSVDLTASRRAGDHLTLGARVTHYEVWPLDAETAARAFASSGADLSIAIDDDRGRRAVIAVGARRLIYKPDADFDWTGPAITVQLEDPLWRGADDRALDLGADYRLERRTYRGLAYVNACEPHSTRPIAECFAPGDRPTVDLVHVASARATYTGARVASLNYELTVDDSTSFGGSLVRHRLTASITTPLPAKIFATATVTAQLDHYPEPPAVAFDSLNTNLGSLDEESRSGASVRVARGLGGAWQLEARWAIQVAASNRDIASYRRQVAYAGVTWDR